MEKEELKSQILKITIQQPIATKRHDMVHSDGLKQTHLENIYGEPISSLRKAIWSSDFTIKEKLEFNEALVSKKLRTKRNSALLLIAPSRNLKINKIINTKK